MEVIHFGIDVGVTGAIAAIDNNADFIEVIDLPVTRISKFAWHSPSLISWMSDVRRGRTAKAWLEYVAPMPKLGVVASAGMGRTHGSMLAILEMAGIAFEMVAPQAWKKKLNVSFLKATTLDLAKSKFPGAADHLTRKKDHNRAEALLIAYYGRLIWTQSGPKT